MRAFIEPTARNLLRRPLVLGVPLMGLIPLAFGVISLDLLIGQTRHGGVASLAVAVLGYALLRMFTRFASIGWEEELVFWLERKTAKATAVGTVHLTSSDLELKSPDTLDETDLLRAKEDIRDQIHGLRAGERLLVVLKQDAHGAKLERVSVRGVPSLRDSDQWRNVLERALDLRGTAYSLIQLPVVTDPLWLFGTLSKLKGRFCVLIRIDALDPNAVKGRLEAARRSNARDSSRLTNIDSEVSFEESSRVLAGLSRGDEQLVELSLVILSEETQPLDPSLFKLETRCRDLALLSVTGVRKRTHRSFTVRAVTASDLVPNVADPLEEGSAILTTLRGNPLYFSPQDKRLESLHWLVVGASGSGKSFLTGLILRRMIQSGLPMSVLFVDHNRSFRRVVRADSGQYLEPETIREVTTSLPTLLANLDRPGATAGIELSDLTLSEKRNASQCVLSEIESFLRSRRTTHPVYVVLDECWNFMRDEPVLVQRAFREFRKLNGAAVAITQSLSDFLTDQSGQSIFQNAPIRILLRQGEDLSQYQGILGLNQVELSKLRLLKQRKGVFSECLIRTPFLSRFGRLFPTEDEHRLLRTDNIREELIAELRELNGEG